MDKSAIIALINEKLTPSDGKPVTAEALCEVLVAVVSVLDNSRGPRLRGVIS